MSDRGRGVALLVVLCCLAPVVALAAPGTPVGVAVGQSGNGTDGGAGSLVAATLEAEGSSVGDAVETPAGPFDRRFYSQAARIKTAYNDDPPDLGFGGGFVTGNLVNLHVTAEDSETTLSFRVTDDNRIETLRAGARSDATIRMVTDRETFEEIATADSPGAAFASAVESGEIRIHGRGLLSSLVWTVLNAIRSLVGVV